MLARKLVLLTLFVALVIALLAVSACGSDDGPTSPNPDASEQRASPQVLQNVSAREAMDLIQKNKANPGFVILDVRTVEEYQAGHLENAVMLDYYSAGFRRDLDKLDKSRDYLIYCRSGHRSSEALKIMAELGFARIYNLADGINGWQGAGLPVVK